MNIIWSHKHEIYTETINKIALSSSDDKRIIRPDKINTLPHGHRAGWHGKQTREPTGLTWEAWQSDRGGLAKWQGRPGKVTGETTGDRGGDRAAGVAWKSDRGGDRATGGSNKTRDLRKIVRIPKRYLLVSNTLLFVFRTEFFLLEHPRRQG